MEKSINLAVAGTQQGKITTIDLTDPTNPQILGEAVKEDDTPAIAFARDISVSKTAGLAYVTTYNAIQVYDIKTPTRPKLLNEITSLADPSGALDRNGNPVMIPIGETPAIVEKGGWVYLANAVKGFRALDLDPVNFKLPTSLLIMATETDIKKLKPVKTYEIPYEIDVFGDTNNCTKPTYAIEKNGTTIEQGLLTNFIGKISINATK